MAGVAALGAGYFAYKEHNKNEEEVRSKITSLVSSHFFLWSVAGLRPPFDLGLVAMQPLYQNSHNIFTRKKRRHGLSKTGSMKPKLALKSTVAMA